MTYSFRYWSVPDHMMDALVRYVEHGVPPGSFLRAVLENNLSEAVGNADDTNARNLPAYVGWLYNEAPGACWGSPEAVQAWLDEKARERRAKEPSQARDLSAPPEAA